MPDQWKETVYLIAGPTAGGKSALALRLAEETGGEIVNADALQVYRDLEILSARPSSQDMARAPHHLYGFLDATQRCSAGAWARRAAAVLAEIKNRRQPAIVVGGSGLYFRALTEGLSPMPAISTMIRDKARKRRHALGAEAFHAEVCAIDPAMARLAVGDTQRLIRAWEVYETTGRTLSSFQAQRGAPIVGAEARRLVLACERADLYARCDARFDAMMAAGALDEAARVAERGVPADAPLMKALGVRDLLAHLRGEISLPHAIDNAKQATRRFAKRQLTWFRNQTADWRTAKTSEKALALLLGRAV